MVWLVPVIPALWWLWKGEQLWISIQSEFQVILGHTAEDLVSENHTHIHTTKETLVLVLFFCTLSYFLKSLYFL